MQRFSALPIGVYFMYGGAVLVKDTSCTARAGRVQLCMVGEERVQRITQ